VQKGKMFLSFQARELMSTSVNAAGDMRRKHSSGRKSTYDNPLALARCSYYAD
jgi:hypothetical protein